MIKRCLIPILVVACLSVAASGQSTSTQIKSKTASPTSEITRFYIDEPTKDSRYETGPLHIVYGDGTEYVKTLPPLERSTEKETVFNDVGFSGVQLAEDRQTIGWTINVENCCTSYSIPVSLVIFRHRQILHTFDLGQMVWSWMFIKGGDRVAVVSGPTHGPEIGDYCLYNARTGKLIAEVWGDEDTQALKPNAPQWAKQLQDRLHNH